MEEFFPSEIARLVLGYLHELKCNKSWQTFIEESSNLSEYFNLYKIGKVYSTNVNGHSLLDILREYCNLKKEANENTCKLECQNDENTFSELENHNALNKDTMEQIVKNAVDHAFQKCFIPVCKDTYDNSVENQASRSNTEEKNKLENQSLNELQKNTIADNNNETNISLKAVNENVTSPQLTGVISLSNFDPSKKKPLIFKDTLFNAEQEDEPMCLLETIKLEKPDEDIQNENICEPKNTAHSKESKLRNSCSIVGEHDAERKSTTPVSDLSNIRQDNALTLNSVNNVDLQNLTKLKNDLKNDVQSSHYIKNENVLDTSDIQNNVPTPCTSLSDGNNIEIAKDSTLSTVIQNDNVVKTINSSSNQSTFIVNNSYPNQCVSSVDNVPTYILSNFLSNSCYLINSISDNKMPLTVTGLPVNNVPNHIYTPINSRSNEISCTMPFPTIIPAPAVVENTNIFKTVAVDEKEHAKRMKLEVISPSTVAAVRSAAADKHSDQKAVPRKKRCRRKNRTVHKVQKTIPELRKGSRRKANPELILKKINLLDLDNTLDKIAKNE